MLKNTFKSFDDYFSSQVETHLEKITLLWFCGLTALPLREASERLLRRQSLSLVCMGSRNGIEPHLFHDYGFARALGTDIAPTANIFPYMMQHDFHDFRPSYVAPFDVLYSNSFDHSYDFDRFLLASRSFLNDQSLIIFDYSPSDNLYVSPGSADCLAISMEEMIERVYSVLGYQLVCNASADPNIASGWKHYKDLRHLIFASPSVFKSNPSICNSLKSEYLDYSCCDKKFVDEYLRKVQLIANHHFSFYKAD